MSKLKDKLFYLAVEKNQDILKEYQTYKWSHEDKEENKLVSWMYLLLLNTKYRVLKLESETRKISNQEHKIKLPYLDGAESEILKRTSPYHFAAHLMQFDVISFDIFDTLILRPFSKPHDLFMLLGEKHNLVDFVSIRRSAEVEAREIAKVKKGNREVTLYDIYEVIEFRTGIDKAYGVQVEFETELELCFANPYMIEVFNILRSQGKEIIAISDMYLSRSMIVQLLDKCGYLGFREIFVSSEHNGSKRDKNLYKIVLKYLGEEIKLVHIGDNYQTDYKCASQLGIEARHYKNVHEVGNAYRADGMSELIGSAYSGIVNTHLHNGVKKYSPQYEYGFIYGGLYVMGYCKWIHDYVKANNIDKVLFLSRDGHIYQKVFNYMFEDVSNEYVYWSRIANLKYTLEVSRNDFLTRMVSHKAVSILGTKIKSILHSLNLNELIPHLKDYGLDKEDIMHNGNIKPLERLFVDNWSLVVEKSLEDIDALKEYLMDVLHGAKKVAVVDVGWTGTGGLGIKYLIEEKFQLNCKVKCLVAATRHQNQNANLHYLMNKDIEAYLFSQVHNKELYDIHKNTNKNTNCIYFELFTQASHPSFAGVKKTNDGYDLLFDIPEVENYKTIDQIHEGIFDFAKIFKSKFENYSYLFNVSGYDAYWPFRMIIRDLRFIREHFGEIRYSRGVYGDSENQSYESLNQIMDELGLN